MSSFPILDLVLGIIFIFFLLSIICSSIVEMVLTIKKTRAKVLGQWLLRIFDTEITNAKGEKMALGQSIMDHCTITALSAEGKAPTYISAKNFTSALLEKIISHGGDKPIPNNIDGFIKAVEETSILSTELKQTFIMYANEANDTFNSLTQKTAGAIEMFQNRIEMWYDTNMERITGTLKVKYTRRFTLYAAIATTLFLNADTIAISKYLYTNPEVRAKVAAEAYKTGTDETIKADMEKLRERQKNDTSTINSTAQLTEELAEKVKDMNEAKAALGESIPLGWTKAAFAIKWYEWIFKLIGMAITVIAVMMGAPFWFDLLNKMANIRGNGVKPATTAAKDKDH